MSEHRLVCPKLRRLSAKLRSGFSRSDTFWLDYRSTLRMLSKYDPRQEWFSEFNSALPVDRDPVLTRDLFFISCPVGASSESREALGMFGRMAFGGAGIVASNPLLASMANQWPKCYEQFKNVFGGDEMLTRCAALARGVEKDDVTTREKGLHRKCRLLVLVPESVLTSTFRLSYRIRHSGRHDWTSTVWSADPHSAPYVVSPAFYAFYALEKLIDIVRNTDYLGGGWVHLFGYGTNHTDFEQIQILQRVAPFLGGDNMFKRYVFGNGKWLLVNGYSITYFEEPLKKNDLQVMVRCCFLRLAQSSKVLC